MIALEFPPVNSTGCYRYLKFLKHINSHDIEVTVIIPTDEDLIMLHPNAKVDETLLINIPNSVKIFKLALSKKVEYTKKEITLKSKVQHYLNYKGEQVARAWKRSLTTCLEEMIKNESVDVVFVSVPPFSLGLVVAEILKKHSIPCIIDFRDEWSLNKGVPFPTYFHYRYAFRNEELMFKFASAITSVTPQLIKIFKQSHPIVPPDKFNLITNGFDFNEINISAFSNKGIADSEKYIIGYSGAYYFDPSSSSLAKLPFYKRPGIKKITYSQDQTKEDWSYRSPLYFFKVMSNLLARRPDLKNKLEFHHVGHIPNWLNEMVTQYNLQENFVAHGFVSKAENIALQNQFNALLCTSEKVINGEHYCISSKVFDYVQMKKPILGFVTPGAVKNFIEESGCGVIFDPDNTEESSMKLEQLINSNSVFIPNERYLKKYHAMNLTNNLESIIKSFFNQ